LVSAPLVSVVMASLWVLALMVSAPTTFVDSACVAWKHVSLAAAVLRWPPKLLLLSLWRVASSDQMLNQMLAGPATGHAAMWVGKQCLLC
jgi:hypothetical protein